MRVLAKRFQISDVGLKKLCVRNRIPVPARGHWQKLLAGKASRRIPLPPMKGPPTISFAPRQAASRDGEPRPPDAAIELETTFPAVKVTETLARPHPVTVAMRDELKRRKPDDYGAIHCFDPNAFSARIHPGSTGRLLRIVDALLKGFERRNFELWPGKRDARYSKGLQVVVDHEPFALSIEERMRRVTHKPTAGELDRIGRGLWVYMKSYDYVPTGEFSLKMEPCYGSGLQSNWKDSRNQQIEQRLSEVMVSLRRHAALRKQEREKAQRRAARLEIELARRAELRARVEAERAAVAKLECDADNWDRARRIRAFVRAVERRPASLQIPDLSTWTEWARGCADRIDPLADVPPSILDTPEADLGPISLWQIEDASDD